MPINRSADLLIHLFGIPLCVINIPLPLVTLFLRHYPRHRHREDLLVEDNDRLHGFGVEEAARASGSAAVVPGRVCKQETPARCYERRVPRRGPHNFQHATDEAQLANDPEFELRFHEHTPRVYGICLHLLGDADRASEAAQATFVRAWQRAAQFREGSNYGAWIAAIATTVCLNEIRAESRRHRQPLFADEHELIPSPQPSPDVGLDLETGVSLLPHATRVVFTLHDIEGYATDDIAQRLGIAPATVRVHIHRARRFLRAYLAT